MEAERREDRNGLVDKINALSVQLARLEEKLMASDKALDLARVALQAWQATSNEWRQENIDQRAMYMTREKVESLISAESISRNALSNRLELLEQKAQVDMGSQKAASSIWAVAVTVTTVIISTTMLVIKFFK